MPRQVNHVDRSAVIIFHRMLEKCDPVALWRKAKVTQIPRSLVEHFPDGKLEPILSINLVDNSESCSIRKPVSLANVLQDLARCSSAYRNFRQRAPELSLRKIDSMGEDCHFPFVDIERRRTSWSPMDCGAG